MAPMPVPPLSTRSPSPTSVSLTTTLSTILSSFTKRTLFAIRQSNAGIIPTTYGNINSGPPPGTVVGIVLGSVAGFLLVLWLIYTCLQFGSLSSRSSYTESIAVRDRRKSHHGSARSRRVSETVEVRRGPSPIRIVREPSRPEPSRPERVERIIVEESRETRRERSRSLVGSDEVVVIEEHSPPRRKKSTRVSAETARRESGYRTVDPGSYGGAVGGRKGGGRR